MSNTDILKKAFNETIKKIPTINIETIRKLFKEEKITISLGESLKNIAFYEKEDKIIYVNRDFYFSNKNTANLEYVLLHEYYHSLENLSSAFVANDDDRNIEDADIFASAIFITNNKSSKYSIKLNKED